jgi:AcrR family transcriptional regulator
MANSFIVIDMKRSMQAPRRKIGRPLSFDRGAALHKAMLLFWRHGYEGTSLSDLTAAMGVTPPSIYRAFGDKKHLFLEAVDRYLSGPVTSESIIADAATAREAARGLLLAAATGFTSAHFPPGCLLASSAISCSAAAADVQDKLAAIRRKTEAHLKVKILGALKAGEIAAETDAGALSAYIMAVIQGMSTLARDGATREKVMRLVDIAMRGWPE